MKKELQSAKERELQKDEFSEMVQDAFMTIHNYMGYLTLKADIGKLRHIADHGHEIEVNALGRVEDLKEPSLCDRYLEGD